MSEKSVRQDMTTMGEGLDSMSADLTAAFKLFQTAFNLAKEANTAYQRHAYEQLRDADKNINAAANHVNAAAACENHAVMHTEMSGIYGAGGEQASAMREASGALGANLVQHAERGNKLVPQLSTLNDLRSATLGGVAHLEGLMEHVLEPMMDLVSSTQTAQTTINNLLPPKPTS